MSVAMRVQRADAGILTSFIRSSQLRCFPATSPRRLLQLLADELWQALVELDAGCIVLQARAWRTAAGSDLLTKHADHLLHPLGMLGRQVAIFVRVVGQIEELYEWSST